MFPASDLTTNSLPASRRELHWCGCVPRSLSLVVPRCWWLRLRERCMLSTTSALTWAFPLLVSAGATERLCSNCRNRANAVAAKTLCSPSSRTKNGLQQHPHQQLWHLTSKSHIKAIKLQPAAYVTAGSPWMLPVESDAWQSMKYSAAPMLNMIFCFVLLPAGKTAMFQVKLLDDRLPPASDINSCSSSRANSNSSKFACIAAGCKPSRR